MSPGSSPRLEVWVTDSSPATSEKLLHLRQLVGFRHVGYAEQHRALVSLGGQSRIEDCHDAVISGRTDEAAGSLNDLNDSGSCSDEVSGS